jgi:hypothetical protein
MKVSPEKVKEILDKNSGDRVSFIMEFENGELSLESTLILFGNLIRTGLAWSLQGAYGRSATSIIEKGFINRQGEIIKNA